MKIAIGRNEKGEFVEGKVLFEADDELPIGPLLEDKKNYDGFKAQAEGAIGFLVGDVEETRGFEENEFGINSLDDWNTVAVKLAEHLNQTKELGNRNDARKNR